MEDDTTILAFLDQICEVFRPEWRVTAKQCVGDDSHGPHVNRLAMSLLQHNFRCRVTKGASHSSQHLVLRVKHLGDTKVSQYERRVGFACKVEQIFGLEIFGIVSADTWNEELRTVPL